MQKIENIRHSLSHIMASAVKEIFPGVKFGIGPAIENGFYYDFEFKNTPSPADLAKIEKRMRETVKSGIAFSKKEISKAEAKEIFKDQPYKLELINDIPDEKVSIYESGGFVDLCAGPHVKSSKEIDSAAFKLTRIAGAYWRGSEKNKMLTRIYGIAFESKTELDSFLSREAEAEKRDHKKLGKELDLFTFSEYIGSGLPLYTQRGALVRRILNGYVEELQSAQGYSQVWTPQIAKAELFKISGHYEKYKDDMFRVISHYSDEEFYLKPMNCPQHTQIYASRQRSYRDLPIRITDFAMLYRDEKPGELNGLGRVRSFSQDDCHIFCTEEQVDAEVDRALKMTKKIMSTFGFKYRYRLSTRDLSHPEKYLGDPKTWDKVEKWAEKIMKRNKIEYYPGPGEAAFYAPKMDLMATDALGREHQLSTVQIDFVMPQRFDLKYIDKDNKEKSPIMIHRAILGSVERFIMILLEHLAGALPLWLAPEQIWIVPIGLKHKKYAKEVKETLSSFRCVVKDENDTIGRKIRQGEMQKIPYLLVIGDKEVKAKSVAVRKRGKGDLGMVKVKKFLEQILLEVEKKK